MTCHDLRHFGPEGRAVSASFDASLREAATSEPAARDRMLAAWETAPSARRAHPREEHLLPLMACAGAAGEDRGRVAHDDLFAGVRLSAFHFG